MRYRSISACKGLSYCEMIAKIGPVHPDILDDIRRTTTWTRNAISIRMFSAETTGPIFTKILHDIMALVASSSKTKPCSHLANVQRMHVVSACLHYCNIIWLSWQRPLTNWKIRYRSIIGTLITFIWWKDCKNRSSKSGDIPRNTPNHDVNTQRNFD